MTETNEIYSIQSKLKRARKIITFLAAILLAVSTYLLHFWLENDLSGIKYTGMIPYLAGLLIIASLILIFVNAAKSY